MKHTSRVAIAGLGGFAGEHHKALWALETEGIARLVATCDPQTEKLAEKSQQLNFDASGVQFYPHFEQMLEAHAHELDFVCLPTPVPLHASMHRACVERKLACYLEKPPTLFWRELEAMLEVEREAQRVTQVGFNYIIEAPRQNLKSRLLAGEFGTLRRVGFWGNWPRATSYFGRTSWAGRLMHGQQLVLDSCIGNAMAHFIHNLLFWCGQNELFSWGRVEQMEAELYRANAIESFDTCFAKGVCESGVELRIAATHAGDKQTTGHREWLECDDAIIIYRTAVDYEVRWNDGRVERAATQTGVMLAENLVHYARYVRGEEVRPLTRLEDTRPFVQLYNLLFVAAGHIHTIAPAHLRVRNANDREWTTVEGIEAAMDTFAKAGQFPSESGIKWSRSGGKATLDNLPQLEATVRKMRTQRAREVTAFSPANGLHIISPALFVKVAAV